MIRVRFAPSPTGALHIGGARTALFNYLIARSSGGAFVLRIDDTDLERSKSEYETDIRDSLQWLGLTWDEGPELGGPCGPYRQSERRDKHLADAQTLVDKNLAYRDDEGVVRLRYPDSEIVVDDRVCGRCVFNPQSLGPEVVLVRSDQTPTYHLASVSDDIAMGITHIVRGQDHLTNTAKHLVLFRGLGHEGPEFAHLPLILGEDGSKLSKRNSTGLTTVAEFRDGGFLPHALVNFLLLLGWSHPEAKEHLSLEEAITSFTVERISTTSSVFQPSQLNSLNGWWIRHLPVDRLEHAIAPFLEEFRPVLERKGESFRHGLIAFLQAEIGSLAEAPAFSRIILDLELTLSNAAKERLADQTFRTVAGQVIAEWLQLVKDTPIESGEEAYSAEDFSKLLAAMKKRSSGDKKSLFQALRIAVMGDVKGPDLGAVIPLISRDILIERAVQAVSFVKEL